MSGGRLIIHDDIADDADLVTWTATETLEIAAAATHAAYIAALESVKDTQFAPRDGEPRRPSWPAMLCL